MHAKPFSRRVIDDVEDVFSLSIMIVSTTIFLWLRYSLYSGYGAVQDDRARVTPLINLSVRLQGDDSATMRNRTNISTDDLRSDLTYYMGIMLGTD